MTEQVYTIHHDCRGVHIIRDDGHTRHYSNAGALADSFVRIDASRERLREAYREANERHAEELDSIGEKLAEAEAEVVLAKEEKAEAEEHALELDTRVQELLKIVGEHEEAVEKLRDIRDALDGIAPEAIDVPRLVADLRGIADG